MTEPAECLKPFFGKHITLVALGDSNTEFNHWSNGRNFLTMISCNASNRFAGITPVNSGHSGDDVKKALARLDRDVLRFHPDVVIVTLGTNDYTDFQPGDRHEKRKGRSQLERFQTGIYGSCRGDFRRIWHPLRRPLQSVESLHRIPLPRRADHVDGERTSSERVRTPPLLFRAGTGSRLGTRLPVRIYTFAPDAGKVIFPNFSQGRAGEEILRNIRPFFVFLSYISMKL